MVVNEIAKRAGVPPHVVRYYARIGLLNPQRHPDNQYRLFSPADVTRIRLIRYAQSVGYNLDEIRSVLATLASGPVSWAWMYRELDNKKRRARHAQACLVAQQDKLDQIMAAGEKSQPIFDNPEQMLEWLERLT
ncbi:MAG: MerR family transcriptional regulator [Pseudomonadota bacterium]|nr:MerR family transcriptional regulator [Pseudomonadota bacterium]